MTKLANVQERKGFTKNWSAAYVFLIKYAIKQRHERGFDDGGVLT